MKGKKPTLDNVVPMKGDTYRAAPPAPEWFPHPEAVEVWDHLVPVLIARDRFEPHHEDLFAAYCVAVGDFIRFSGELAVMGNYYQVETRNGLQEKKRAAWGQRQDALATMQRIGALYGMSPVDEARLSNGAQGDLFDQLKREMNGDAS